MIVEGNSFLDYIKADFAITCARAGENKMKSSARRTLARADALYLSTIDDCDRPEAIRRFDEWRGALTGDLNIDNLTIFTRDDLPELIESILGLFSRRRSLDDHAGSVRIAPRNAGAPT